MLTRSCWLGGWSLLLKQCVELLHVVFLATIRLLNLCLCCTYEVIVGDDTPPCQLHLQLSCAPAQSASQLPLMNLCRYTAPLHHLSSAHLVCSCCVCVCTSIAVLLLLSSCSLPAVHMHLICTTFAPAASLHHLFTTSVPCCLHFCMCSACTLHLVLLTQRRCT